MAQQTGISWTDATFNPWRGCVEVSSACDNCYAARMSLRNPAVLGRWGSDGTRVVAAEKYWQEPFKWNREAEASGVRRRVFCASLADVFEDWRGAMVDHLGEVITLCDNCLDEYGCEDPQPGCHQRPVRMNDIRVLLFNVIQSTPWLDWLLLTKRPENILRKWPCLKYRRGELNTYGEEILHDIPLPLQNVWLGTTVENQEQAVKRIPELLKCRDLAPVLFLSCEPLLGPVDLRNIQVPSDRDKLGPDQRSDDLYDVLGGEICSGETGCVVAEDQATIDWVISGGESGSKARPSHPDWFYSLRDQCAAADVPFHHKQWGEWQEGSARDKPQAAVLNNGDYCFPDTFEGRQALASKLFGRWNEYRPTVMAKVGVMASGRLLDDVLHDAFPVVEART